MFMPANINSIQLLLAIQTYILLSRIASKTYSPRQITNWVKVGFKDIFRAK